MVSLGRPQLASGTWAGSAGREQTCLKLCGVPEMGDGVRVPEVGDEAPEVRDGVPEVGGWGL